MEESNLLKLANSINAQTRQLVDLLRSRGCKEPSFDAESAAPDFIAYSDRELRQIRDEIVDSSRALADVLVGPKSLIMEHTTGVLTNMAMDALYSYKIHEHVPLEGSISYIDLSKACGLDHTTLRRLVRCLIYDRVFSEPKPEYVAHSSVSRYMVDSPLVMGWIGHHSRDMARATTYHVSAMQKYDYPRKPIESGYGLMAGMEFFDSLKTEPYKVGRFMDAMKWVSGPYGFHSASEASHVFDWKSLGKGKLVDIGGSTGHVAAEILSNAPEMQAVVQDLPEVVAQAHKFPESVASRMTFQAHSFFEPEPIKDADVYFMRAILHDWPDHSCKEILANLVPSMKSGSLLMLQEFVLLAPGEGHHYDQAFARKIDLMMLSCISGRERTLDDWNELVLTDHKDLLVLHSVTPRSVIYKKL